MRHEGDASQQRAFRRQVVQELSSAGPCTKGRDLLRIWVRKYQVRGGAFDENAQVADVKTQNVLFWRQLELVQRIER